MKNNQGFTLVEMLTSIAIIVMITAIFTANYKTSNRRSDLIMTAQKLVADIHLAQNNSLGLVTYNDEVPAAGWGINFNTSSDAEKSKYTVFADLSEPGYNEGNTIIPPSAGYMNLDAGEFEERFGARIVELPQGIVIDSLVVGNGVTVSNTTNLANVTFLPPDPRTNIFSAGNIYDYVVIRLKDVNSGFVKTIRVNFLGLAEVTD